MNFAIYLDTIYAGNSIDSYLRDLSGEKIKDAKRTPSGSLVWVKGRGSAETRLARVIHKSGNPDLHLTTIDLGKWYLAGPMRGKPMHNFPAFLTAAAHLRSLGLKIVNPAEHDLENGFSMTKPLDQQRFSVEKALGWDFTQIIECDGIILLDGWAVSEGAKAERLIAHMTGKQVLRLGGELTLFSEPGWHCEVKWIHTMPEEPKKDEPFIPVDEPQKRYFGTSPETRVDP